MAFCASPFPHGLCWCARLRRAREGRRTDSRHSGSGKALSSLGLTPGTPLMVRPVSIRGTLQHPGQLRSACSAVSNRLSSPHLLALRRKCAAHRTGGGTACSAATVPRHVRGAVEGMCTHNRIALIRTSLPQDALLCIASSVQKIGAVAVQRVTCSLPAHLRRRPSRRASPTTSASGCRRRAGSTCTLSSPARPSRWACFLRPCAEQIPRQWAAQSGMQGIRRPCKQHAGGQAPMPAARRACRAARRQGSTDMCFNGRHG